MKSFCIGVLAGSLLSLFLPIVPPIFTVFIVIPLILLLPASARLVGLGLLAYMLSLSWQVQQHQHSHQQLIAGDGVVRGVISDTVQHFAEYSQFRLHLDEGVATGSSIQLTLGHYAGDSVSKAVAAKLKPGQRWQWQVRLRPVTGLANPGGANREAQALIEGVVAQGSIADAASAQLLSEQYSLRQRLIDKIELSLLPLKSADVLRALISGERQFNDELWQGLKNSGLAHLMAISGLHIGLVFGFSLLLARVLWLPLRWQTLTRPVSLLLALGMAAAYAWLSGFAIPSQRALLALALLVATLLLQRRFSYSGYWLLLVTALLLWQPFYLLSKSFWLSVLAMAAILWLLWRTPLSATTWRQKITAFFSFHLQLTLIMSVVSLLFFSGSSTLALLSNLVFVPFTSLLAIPLLMFATLFTLIGLPFSALLWRFTDNVFTPLLLWLEYCSQANSWLSAPDISAVAVITLVVSSLALMLHRSKLALSFAVVSGLGLLLPWWQQGFWQLHVIDVGQGLAVLLQHDRQALLYDAGPRYGSHSATASQVLPYLRHQGIKQLDYLVLSHDDSDHTGDWELLRRNYPEVKLISDIDRVQPDGSCLSLNGNYLDASITVLHSDSGQEKKNDTSCTLLLGINGWRILLPGDISRAIELQLLAHYPDLTADILLLPHHGSASSSDFTFLFKLAPHLALNSASRYNRHNHPSAEVLQRLNMFGIPLFNTADSGAIKLIFRPDKVDVVPFRVNRLPLWL